MQKKNIVKTLLLHIAILIFTDLSAQNVGIGTNEPQEKLQVTGNLLIQQPYASTNTAPTPAQTKTMVNGIQITVPFLDSTGRIYDPGGPAGNYLANLSANVFLHTSNDFKGIEISIEDMDLNTGDSLIITNSDGDTLFKAGNGYSTTGKYIFNVTSLNFKFKSNSDGQTGRGFSLLFKWLYTVEGVSSPNNAFGNAIYFDANKGIFRAGNISPLPSGNYSTAIGYLARAGGLNSSAIGTNANASGVNSIAIGSSAEASGHSAYAFGSVATASGYSSTTLGTFTTASGNYSTALGRSTTASGDYSTALGNSTDAIGDYSTALGNSTIASGGSSTALGNFTTASGDYSFSVGYKVTAAQKGSFFFGDSDPDLEGITANGSPDEFVCRFNNGYYFMTSGGNNNDGTPRTGVRVLPGGNSWSAISDVRLKENFEPVDGESFLHKIGAMPQYTWNYKGQNALTYRHYGPMAQDFYKAFGKDKYGSVGCDTLINQQDFLGVNLVAIQALVKRTEILNTENSELKQQLAILQKKLDELNSAVIKRLQQLETLAVQQKGD